MLKGRGRRRYYYFGGVNELKPYFALTHFPQVEPIPTFLPRRARWFSRLSPLFFLLPREKGIKWGKRPVNYDGAPVDQVKYEMSRQFRHHGGRSKVQKSSSSWSSQTRQGAAVYKANVVLIILQQPTINITQTFRISQPTHKRRVWTVLLRVSESSFTTFTTTWMVLSVFTSWLVVVV